MLAGDPEESGGREETGGRRGRDVVKLSDSVAVSKDGIANGFVANTLSGPWGCRLGPERILLRAPFENLFIPLALDTLLITL